MPDPSLSDVLAEANALAPAEEIVWSTIEVRHDDFTDDSGEPDSIWLVQGSDDLQAPLEAGAPIKGGQWVTWRAIAFTFALPAIEPGTTPEIEITIDGVNRALLHYLDLAVSSGKPLTLIYRPYLDTAIADGPQMDPPPSFEASEITVDMLSVVVKARTGVDLRVGFPRRKYTLAEFPGLAGR
ncbi:DUF1833 family protein [Reyranella sp.]|uniref:DUF1833 family protein n=1 Tax=Reyranella sp. TaxID=1929291 RepID=UPI003D12C856